MRKLGTVSWETINNWVSNSRMNPLFTQVPESRQHFDVWSFQKADGESSYFGKLPPQVIKIRP